MQSPINGRRLHPHQAPLCRYMIADNIPYVRLDIAPEFRYAKLVSGRTRDRGPVPVAIAEKTTDIETVQLSGGGRLPDRAAQ